MPVKAHGASTRPDMTQSRGASYLRRGAPERTRGLPAATALSIASNRSFAGLRMNSAESDIVPRTSSTVTTESSPPPNGMRERPSVCRSVRAVCPASAPLTPPLTMRSRRSSLLRNENSPRPSMKKARKNSISSGRTGVSPRSTTADAATRSSKLGEAPSAKPARGRSDVESPG